MTAATDDSRFRARAMAVLAAVALVLALVGIYGVVAFAVGQHTREIGIRIALGASQRDIVRLSVGAGLVPALSGAAIGIPAAALTGRAIQNWLYGVNALDLGALVSVSALLLLASAAASWIPAQRAARIEPTAALRAE